MPTFQVYQNGKKVEELQGANMAKLNKIIAKYEMESLNAADSDDDEKASEEVNDDKIHHFECKIHDFSYKNHDFSYKTHHFRRRRVTRRTKTQWWRGG